MITYIPSQWLAFQTNPNIPKELKQITTAAVWFSAGGSDIRKFHPWFDLQPKFHYRNHNFLNTFREILSHHIWYFPPSLSQWIHLYYRSLYVWIVGEWMTTRKSLCYLLFLIIEDKNILKNYIQSCFRYNVVHYSALYFIWHCNS